MHATFNTLFNAQLYNYENSLKRYTTIHANCTNLHLVVKCRNRYLDRHRIWKR